MVNAVLKTLEERRSIRDFSDKRVEEDKLAAIIKAGTYAPTGMGKQSPKIIVIDSPEVREKFRRMNATIMGSPDRDPFYGAPTIILVIADESIRTCIEDGSLVIGNMLNAAYSLGVDSIWIHRAREEMESAEGKAFLADLGITGNYIGIGHVALGYRKCEYPTSKERKSDYVYIV